MTYSIHVYQTSMVDTFKLNIYKTKKECFLWLGIAIIFSYTSYRFRILGDLDVVWNGLGSALWMVSFYVFALLNLKLKLGRTIKIGTLTVISIIGLDMLTSVQVVFGFGERGLEAMPFISSYVEFYAGACFLMVAYYISQRRMLVNERGQFGTRYLFVLISAIAVIYYVSANVWTMEQRMNKDVFPVEMMGVYILVFFISLGFLYYHFKQNKIRQEKIMIDIMEAYVSVLEDVNADMRHYKHDIENIIFGLREYVESRDYMGLKVYFRQEIQSQSPTQSHTNNIIKALRPVEINVLKGAVLSAVNGAENRSVKLIVDSESIRLESASEMTFFSLMLGEILKEIFKLYDQYVLEECRLKFYYDASSSQVKQLVAEVSLSGTGDVSVISSKYTSIFSKFNKYGVFKSRMMQSNGLSYLMYMPVEKM